MLRHEDRWVVSADDLFRANVLSTNQAFRQALEIWSGTEVTVYPPTRPDEGEVFTIYGDRPLPNGNFAVMVESLAIPSMAERPLRWDVIAPVGIGVLVLGAGAVWWSRRQRPLAASASQLRATFRDMGMTPLRTISTPSGSRCHDGKRFVPNARCRL
jgi:hypothetical protein